MAGDPSRGRFDTILRDGMVATSAGSFTGAVAVRDGEIAEIWHGSPPEGVEAAAVVDCADRWVLPGGVDPHVHVGISFGDVQTSEDHRQCTVAALTGGTTTIVDFAIPQADQSPLEAVEQRQALAEGNCATDYALHGCFTERDAGHLDQIPALVDRGVRSIKLYTTYRGELMATDGVIREVMTRLLPYQGLTYIHAEDNSIIEELMADLAGRGPIPYELIRTARPESAEDKAVRHILELAGEVGAPVYFVHQSTAVALELGRAARARGQRVYAEVCPHYALLDDERLIEHHGECFTCCPPLRGRPTVDAVMARLVAGEVDTVGSDHCAFLTKHKVANAHDLRTMPFGMPGVQTRMPIMLSELFLSQRAPMSTVVDLLCTTPARLSGLYPRKGAIQVGADADLVVWSAQGSTTVDSSLLRQASDYSPFDGWQVRGRIEQVYRHGELVIGDGARDVAFTGRTLPSGPILG